MDGSSAGVGVSVVSVVSVVSGRRVRTAYGRGPGQVGGPAERILRGQVEFREAGHSATAASAEEATTAQVREPLAGPRSVAVPVASISVQERPAVLPGAAAPQVRTPTNPAGQPHEHLESVLGATPHEFESRILRSRLNRRDEEPSRCCGSALRRGPVAFLVAPTVDMQDISRNSKAHASASNNRGPIPAGWRFPAEPDGRHRDGCGPQGPPQ
jgi:hypothetical protein